MDDRKPRFVPRMTTAGRSEVRRGLGVSGRGGGFRGEEPCWAVGESSAQREPAESSSSLKDKASVAGRWSERVAWREGDGEVGGGRPPSRETGLDS